MRVKPLIALMAFVVGAVLGLLVIAGPAILHGQKAERGTQQWNIDIGNGSVVRVIDTTGVCLYVGLGESWGSPSSRTLTVTAVSKAQMPQGAGCQ